MEYLDEFPLDFKVNTTDFVQYIPLFFSVIYPTHAYVNIIAVNVCLENKYHEICLVNCFKTVDHGTQLSLKSSTSNVGVLNESKWIEKL